MFFTLVLVGMLLNKETVVSVVIGIVFLTAVTLYYLIRYHKGTTNIIKDEMKIDC